MPTPPRPMTTTVSPGWHVGGVDRRAPAGGDAAADQRGPLGGDVVLELDAAGLAHDGVGAEGAETAHGPRSLPSLAWWREVMSVTWRPASRKAPRSHRCCQRAHEGQRPQAGMNPSATWSPSFSVVTLGADLDHLAGALVAADHGKLLEAHHRRDLGVEHQVAGHEVLVGVAHARGRQLDLHLTGLRGVELDVLDAPLGPRLPQDRCSGLHRFCPLLVTGALTSPSS